MKSSIDDIIKVMDENVLYTYVRKPLAFVKAKGSRLTNIDNRKYLDFFPGWGVSNIGHCHKRVVKALTEQVKKIIHMANVFYSPLQGEVAKKIISHSFPGKVFFSNSGTESVECAIKAAKSWGNKINKNEFISFERSFHGRTLGSVSLTGQSKYRDPFLPVMPNVKYAEYNNIDSLKKLLTDKTCAIILELVQGEGGIRVADKQFVKELSKLQKERNFLLIIDEVQTGFGRTGTFFAFQNYDLKPDILCLGKSIAAGVPMGATVLAKNIESSLLPGMHASTFGGNYLACSASNAVFEVFEKEKVLEKMPAIIVKFKEFFEKLKNEYKEIIEFRCLGMMYGLEMESDYALKIVDKALEEGLIINCTAGNVIRIMPALNINEADMKKGFKILNKVFKYVCKKRSS